MARPSRGLPLPYYPTATSDLHLKAATIQGRKIFTVKAASWSSTLRAKTGNGSSGLIIAFDSETCLPRVTEHKEKKNTKPDKTKEKT